MTLTMKLIHMSDNKAIERSEDVLLPQKKTYICLKAIGFLR